MTNNTSSSSQFTLEGCFKTLQILHAVQNWWNILKNMMNELDLLNSTTTHKIFINFPKVHIYLTFSKQDQTWRNSRFQKVTGNCGKECSTRETFCSKKEKNKTKKDLKFKRNVNYTCILMVPSGQQGDVFHRNPCVAESHWQPATYSRSLQKTLEERTVTYFWFAAGKNTANAGWRRAARLQLAM